LDRCSRGGVTISPTMPNGRASKSAAIIARAGDRGAGVRLVLAGL
jgi:hypothetical protein